MSKFNVVTFDKPLLAQEYLAIVVATGLQPHLCIHIDTKAEDEPRVLVKKLFEAVKYCEDDFLVRLPENGFQAGVALREMHNILGKVPYIISFSQNEGEYPKMISYPEIPFGNPPQKEKLDIAPNGRILTPPGNGQKTVSSSTVLAEKTVWGVNPDLEKPVFEIRIVLHDKRIWAINERGQNHVCIGELPPGNYYATRSQAQIGLGYMELSKRKKGVK